MPLDMPTAVARPLAYAAANRGRFVEQLARLLRFPSISALPHHRDEVACCAQWLADHLRQIGLDRVGVARTSRNPVVYGSWTSAGPGRPTLLVYGHYDVQPTGPARAWRSPPFAPHVRGDHLFARGASDDKGQLFVHLKAIESCLRTAGRLPVNVKVLLDGAEEVGSPGLAALVARHRHALAADAAIISDSHMLGPGRPAVVYGLRGQLAVELTARGAAGPLHAGTFGGAAPDPALALARILAGLQGTDGRITLPRFYPRVRPASSAERRALATVGPSDPRLLADARAARPGPGETGFSLFERTTLRPALIVHSLTAGHQGAGTHAAIAPIATAKIGFRLVPDQDPHEVAQAVREYLARVTPPGVRVALRVTATTPPALVDRRHPAIRAAALACRDGFGARPAFVRSGGSMPVVDILRQHLGVPAVLLGFALPDSRVHGVDERLHLPTFDAAIRCAIHFLHRLADVDLSPGVRPWHGRVHHASQTV